MHELKTYFQNRKGFGILATADSAGRVNTAVYATPHFMEDGSLAFIMQERLTHSNLLSNPNASYLFREEIEGHKGKRIYLKKLREEMDTALLYSLRRRTIDEGEQVKTLYLVFFKVEKVLPLLGAEE